MMPSIDPQAVIRARAAQQAKAAEQARLAREVYLLSLLSLLIVMSQRREAMKRAEVLGEHVDLPPARSQPKPVGMCDQQHRFP